MNSPSMFISCGEVSGDMYAADFVHEFLSQAPEFTGRIWGMTGPLTDSAVSAAVHPAPHCGDSAGCGLNSNLKTGEHPPCTALPHWSYEELKLMGFLEVLPSVPRLLRLRRRMIRAIMEISPAAAVLVDSPDFHLGLASGLRKAGYRGKLICLITPTVWAWRSGRTKTLRECFDLSLPLFSFEHRFLTERGVNSAWTAHPLVWELRDCRPPSELVERIGGRKAIAFMPGSRKYDISYHLDTLIGAAEIMRGDGYLPIFSIAPGLSQYLKDELTERLSGFETWSGEGRGLMSACCAAAGVSGTVAVEAMLLRRFMVVIYNMNPLSYAVLKRLVNVRNISIPNMLTDAHLFNDRTCGDRDGIHSKAESQPVGPGTCAESGPVFPELLCGDATPVRIADELRRYLGDERIRETTERRLEAARGAMGGSKASSFWAESVIKAMRNA